MSQIFISYSSKDRTKVKSLARILEKEKHKVWWDKDIPPGACFDRAKKLGAHPTGSISGQTDFLIVGQSAGKTKLADAEKYSVKIMEEGVWNDIVSTL